MPLCREPLDLVDAAGHLRLAPEEQGEAYGESHERQNDQQDGHQSGPRSRGIGAATAPATTTPRKNLRMWMRPFVLHRGVPSSRIGQGRTGGSRRLTGSVTCFSARVCVGTRIELLADTDDRLEDLSAGELAAAGSGAHRGRRADRAAQVVAPRGTSTAETLDTYAHLWPDGDDRTMLGSAPA